MPSSARRNKKTSTFMNYFALICIAFLISVCPNSRGEIHTNIACHSDDLHFREPIALFDTFPKKILFNHEFIQSISIGHNEPIAKNTIDYDFLPNGHIRRLQESKIFDFFKYKIITDVHGNFNFSTTPVRNPPLTVDKVAVINYCLPESYKKKLTGKGNPFKKALLIGDSITAGAHTSGHYYGLRGTSFSDLLTRQLEHRDVTIEKLSEEGVAIEYLTNSLPRVLLGNYDVVIIGLGMNGHLRGLDGIEDWSNQLRHSVKKLSEKGIEVILLGFFHQNPKWNLEKVEDSALYNLEIVKIADEFKNVAHIEIEKKFVDLKALKNFELEILADGLHHPSDIGHLVYFEELIPYFYRKGESFVVDELPDFRLSLR